VLEKVTEAALTLPIEVTQLVTVVDGARLADDAPLHGRFQRLLRNQVQCATDVMVNKCDLIEHPERVAELMRSWKENVPITYTINGRPNDGNEAIRMPWERVVRNIAIDLSVRLLEPARDHGAKPLQVVCWEHIPDITTDQWRTWLDQWTAQLYRAKGIVRIDGRRHLLQFAYKAHSWTPLPEQKDAKTVLILIGEWSDSEAMERSLRTKQVMAR
jgi:G3E family GTPase